MHIEQIRVQNRKPLQAQSSGRGCPRRPASDPPQWPAPTPAVACSHACGGLLPRLRWPVSRTCGGRSPDRATGVVRISFQQVIIEPWIANERRASNGIPAHEGPVRVGRSLAMQRPIGPRSTARRSRPPRVERLGRRPPSPQLHARRRVSSTIWRPVSEICRQPPRGRQILGRRANIWVEYCAATCRGTGLAEPGPGGPRSLTRLSDSPSLTGRGPRWAEAAQPAGRAALRKRGPSPSQDRHGLGE